MKLSKLFHWKTGIKTQSAEKECQSTIQEKDTDITFLSSELDNIFSEIRKYKPSRTVRYNDRNVLKVLVNSCIDALGVFFSLKNVDISNLEQRYIISNGYILRMNISNGRYIEFTTFSSNPSDYASIIYMNEGRKITLIRFVNKL